MSCCQGTFNSNTIECMCPHTTEPKIRCHSPESFNFESDATSSHFAIYETRRKEQEGRSNIIKIMTKHEAAGQVPDQEEQLRTMEKSVRVNCEVPLTAMMFWSVTCRLDRARRNLDDQLRDAICRVAISPCSCSSSFFFQ